MCIRTRNYSSLPVDICSYTIIAWTRPQHNDFALVIIVTRSCGQIFLPLRPFSRFVSFSVPLVSMQYAGYNFFVFCFNMLVDINAEEHNRGVYIYIDIFVIQKINLERLHNMIFEKSQFSTQYCRLYVRNQRSKHLKNY